MGRWRRRFKIWEWLAVLSAHNGGCLYCVSRSQTMDHVIPFSDGGADQLKNLLPICRPCNRKKGKKNPVVWFVAMDLSLRWSGEGSLLDGSSYENKSLRELYLLTHPEVLEALDELEAVQAEVLDERRTDWFRRKFEAHGYPSARFGVPRARAYYDAQIREGKAKGYPTAEQEWAELRQRLGIEHRS
ncbi:HNH endonuclease [Streptomyces sp. NRRL S-920]|uniref:HNH endonuclease n=1 Tax=Streptomyces sp. NRRL S-920 TaxID=1463921 RepID=UPI00055E19FA|nr:HNH endonuclease signature motif containing protein [Streptomyces sp. NRRL S-920]